LSTALEGAGISPPFQALVAYYPGCRLPPRSRLGVDTLILFGADDNPASIERCKALALALRDTRHPAALTIYPHATHNFDDTNSEAAMQSFAAAEAFLAEHLKAQNLRAR
jgi:dienelactone hydrolase